MGQRLCLLLIAVVMLFSLPVEASEADEVLYVIPLKGEIGAGMARFIERGFHEAQEKGASAILLEIGTLGGFLNSALDIKDTILDSPIPVYAYVKGRAWSAGALIAIACDGLVMAPGSSIGAAEPRPLEEKTLSAWRAELEATAERRGRDPLVAAAMADADISIPDVVKKGELLTLSAKKALEIGFADALADRVLEVPRLFGLERVSLVEVAPTSAERLAQFVTHPTVAPVLLTLGFLGLVIEVFTAGWGVAGTVGLICLFLYFGGALLAGVPGMWVLLLFVGGIILLFVEALIPGFGVFGLSGIVAIVISIYLASAADPQALRSLVVAMVSTVLLAIIVARYALRKGLWRRLSLPYSLDTERGFVPTKPRQDLVGKEGVAITPLRPSGMADIEGRRIDVVTEGTYVTAGSALRITAVEGGRVVVKVIEKKPPAGGTGG